MSVLAALTGDAAEIPPAEGQALFEKVLAKDEPVKRAYILFRDAFVLMDRRSLLPARNLAKCQRMQAFAEDDG